VRGGAELGVGRRARGRGNIVPPLPPAEAVEAAERVRIEVVGPLGHGRARGQGQGTHHAEPTNAHQTLLRAPLATAAAAFLTAEPGFRPRNADATYEMVRFVPAFFVARGGFSGDSQYVRGSV